MRVNRRKYLLWLLLFVSSCNPSGQRGVAPEGALYPEDVLTDAERRQEASEKEQRVVQWLRREGLSAVLLSTPSNFAWITSGANCCPDPAAPLSVSLLVREDGKKFVFDRGGRAGRFLADQLQRLGFEIRRTPWSDNRRDWEPSTEVLKGLVGEHPYASDKTRADARPAEREIAALRVPLTEWEVRKYRWLGRSCAAAVDSVCRKMERWWTDRGVETLLSKDLLQRAIQPVEVRVEADTAVPGTATRKISDYALVSVRASRWGLMVAMKRAVHFGPLPPSLRRSEEAVARIEAGLWARTVPGSTAAVLAEGLIADCAAVGFPDAWRRETPGGMTGYGACDWEAVPGSQERVSEFEAFTWNAAIGDFAMEDTILLDGDRLVVLTEVPGWPVIESRALGRIYRLPAILQIDR